jgi:hypothetical protein
MQLKNIENIELKFLEIEDYQELKDAMVTVYKTMPDTYWTEDEIKTLIKKFP